MQNEGEHPARHLPPLCVTLGADHSDTPQVVAQLAQIIQRRKTRQINNPLHMLYFNIGNGEMAGHMVDMCCSPLRISGTEQDEAALESAKSLLARKKSLGLLYSLDPSNSPASALRNKFECVGGADMVVYAHGAYPHRLPQFKLTRMVERLNDLTAPHGAVVTLHHYGPSDVDHLRRNIGLQPHFAAAGVACNTQHRLENAFNEGKMYAFSVIMPNCFDLPANLVALDALFAGDESSLTTEDARDAALIRQVLEQVAGGKEALDETLQGAESLALRFFKDRIAEHAGASLPITLGGGQMVMAFHSLELAQEAFLLMQAASRSLPIPSIVLPISTDVAPSFDKRGTYEEWTVTLRKRGILQPPQVAQMHRMQPHLSL